MPRAVPAELAALFTLLLAFAQACNSENRGAGSNSGSSPLGGMGGSGTSAPAGGAPGGGVGGAPPASGGQSGSSSSGPAGSSAGGSTAGGRDSGTGGSDSSDAGVAGTGGTSGRDAGPPVDLPEGVTDLFPLPGATAVCPDPPLRLSFSA